MKAIGVALAALMGVLLLTGCSEKMKEPFRDAPLQGRNDAPAMAFTMPDGFSNGATKCLVPGIRVTTIYHGNSKYGAVTMIQDPNCK